jgi:hypothetical protein
MKPSELTKYLGGRFYRVVDVDPLLVQKDAEIEDLKTQLRQQKDECERFHKPA